MKNLFNYVLASLLVFAFACEKTSPSEMTLSSAEAIEARRAFPQGANERVVVANRASRDLSVIDAATNTLLATIPMPDNGEPMYVVHIKQAKAFFVGDRANNRVVAFDEDDYSVKGTVPAGAGVFHMWASPNGSQLWVNNDIDNTTTVINPISMQVQGTAVTPPDLVALGGKPHDVFVDPNGRFAYVSVLGIDGDNDYVVKYRARQFDEVGRVAVGQDPHLSATSRNTALYVACQNSNEVYVVNRYNLAVEEIIPFDGAHGAGMSNAGDYFYTADIVGSRLGTIDTQTNELVGDPVSSPFPRAHNLAINAADTQLYVTHSSGTSDQLTVYDLSPTPSFATSITVGLNPFGLTYYRY